MRFKEGVIVRTTDCYPINSPGALNHGYTALVVGSNIKYQVHIEILIYQLILFFGSPFNNHSTILLIHRRNADSIVNN